MTVISISLILSFTLMEFIDYRRVHMDTSVIVDRSRGERLGVKFNVTFHKVPCYRESFSFPASAKTLFIHWVQS